MRFPCPLLSLLLSGLTLPVVGLLLGTKATRSQSPQPSDMADWWWGDERLPPLRGNSIPKL
ncbi:MAG: hypothetical protein AB4050_03265 [Synechococcus sp.]